MKYPKQKFILKKVNYVLLKNPRKRLSYKLLSHICTTFLNIFSFLPFHDIFSFPWQWCCCSCWQWWKNFPQKINMSMDKSTKLLSHTLHTFIFPPPAVSMTNKLTRMLKSIVLSLNTVAMGTSPENLKIYRS